MLDRDDFSGVYLADGVNADIVAQRGRFVSIYGWSGDGTGKTRAALQALRAYGNFIDVHDPGEEGTASRAYWDRMLAECQVDELVDGEGQLLARREGSVIREHWSDVRRAANGRRICDNLADWFVDSKMTDESGRPRVFYHGTRADFDAFQPGNWQAGHFFTAEAAYAAIRALDDEAETDSVFVQLIVPVYLRIANPLDVTNGLRADDAQRLQEAGADHDALEWLDNPRSDQWVVFDRAAGGEAFAAATQRAGFDGVVFNEINDVESRSIAYAVFSSAQIKSAIGNSGLYLRGSDSLTDLEADLRLRRGVQARMALASDPCAWSSAMGNRGLRV